MASVFQINISPQGGVPKRAIAFARVGANGIEGDKQKHTKIHGGPERAVCLWSIELIDHLNAEGHKLFSGAAGENLTLEGVDWQQMAQGTRLRLGDEVELQLTRFAHPCCAIEEYFIDWKPERIAHRQHPGWSRIYARVLAGGTIRPGDVVTIVA